MNGGGIRDWLVFSDVHILFIAACWILGNGAVLGYQVPLPFVALASVGAFLVYRIDRFWVESPEDALNVPERVSFSEGHRLSLMVFALILTLMAALLALTMQVLWLEAAMVVGALGLVYPLRILPGGRRPKDIAWLKTSLIAFCWVGGGVMLPFILFSEPAIELDQGWIQAFSVLTPIAVYRVAYIMPNLLVADWLDRSGDAEQRAGNLTVAWSVEKLRLLIGSTALLGVVAALALYSRSPLILVDLIGLTAMALAALNIVRSHPAPDGDATTARMTLLDVWVAWPVVVWFIHSTLN